MGFVKYLVFLVPKILPQQDRYVPESKEKEQQDSCRSDGLSAKVCPQDCSLGRDIEEPYPSNNASQQDSKEQTNSAQR
jgi:hypothetical protein